MDSAYFRKNGIKDVGLVEKTIRAFCLLESLARTDCPFVFKGGSCQMLHFNTSKRLSIDIDIVCPLGTDIEKYLNVHADEYGFAKPNFAAKRRCFESSRVYPQHTLYR